MRQAVLVLSGLLYGARAGQGGPCHTFYTQEEAKELRRNLSVPHGFKSCALVGSSGLLLHERLGAKLDQYDMVMRFNTAPIHGVESVVGSKTTIRMINGAAFSHAFDRFAMRGSTNMTDFCPNYTVLFFENNLALKHDLITLCGNRTTVLDVHQLVRSVLAMKITPYGSAPMSGIIGVAVAAYTCQKGVDVYGFTHEGTAGFNNVVPYHYYGNITPAVVDDLPQTAKRLSNFAAEDGRGCINLDTPVKLLPRWEPKGNTSRAAESNDPLADPEWKAPPKVLNSSCPKFYDSAGAKLLRSVLNKPDGYESCAMVGSSGMLLLQRRGALLDKKEMVMRFNFAPTEGYEPVVGSNTTVRLLSSQAIEQMLINRQVGTSEQTSVDGDVCPQYAVLLTDIDASTWLAFNRLCKNRTLVLPPYKGNEIDSVYAKSMPSGFNTVPAGTGMVIASMMCRYGVDVYGMQHSTHLNVMMGSGPIPFHYYDSASAGTHDGENMNMHVLSHFKAREGAGCVRVYTARPLFPTWKPRTKASRGVVGLSAEQGVPGPEPKARSQERFGLWWQGELPITLTIAAMFALAAVNTIRMRPRVGQHSTMGLSRPSVHQEADDDPVAINLLAQAPSIRVTNLQADSWLLQGA